MPDPAEESQKHNLSKIRPHSLTLQLHILLDMGFSSDGLMCASPDGPCNDVSGVDPSLGEADGDAAEFLHRPADHGDGALWSLTSSFGGSFLGAAWHWRDAGSR